MTATTPLARTLTLGLALALGLAASALGQDPAGPGAGAGGTTPSDPSFVATLTDGSTVSGRVRRLGDGESLALVDAKGEERVIAIDRLVKLVRDGAPPPSPTDGGDLVLFPDGDRIAHGKVGAAGDFSLAVHSMALDDLAIPLDTILGLVFEAPAEPGAVDPLIAQVRTESRDSERAWMANGDRINGLFAGLDERSVTFQMAAGKVDLPRSGNARVLALGFAPGQIAYRRPEGPFLELTLIDGSRFGVTGARLERGQVVATARFKAPIKVPIAELAQVHALGGSVLYLSDRPAIGTVYQPYIGPTRPYRRDLTVTGEPIRLGGRTFDRGLGTQSRTLLAYKLVPGLMRFQAQVGVDDRAGPLGNVVFKVRVDGKVLFESPPMAAGEPPRAVDVDLAGAQLLILMTEFGDRGDVQDNADWAEARLIR